MSASIVSQALIHASATPEALALAGPVGTVGTVTYGCLRDRVVSAAALLRRLGVSPGDRVVLAAAQSPEFVYGYLAAHLVGAVAVPLAPDMPAAAWERVHALVTPRVTFVAGPDTKPGDRCLPLAELAKCRKSNDDFPQPKTDAVADILFTTGTTGTPKGVVLTHTNIATQAAAIQSFIGTGAGDRDLLPLPLHHSFGLGRLRSSLWTGGLVIFSEGLKSVGDLFDAMRGWQATAFSSVPAGLALLFRLTGDAFGEFAPHLRSLEIGSASMSRTDKERLIRLLPHSRLCMHYGLTEASRAAYIEFHESSHKLDAVGKASPNVEIRVVDESGQPVDSGGEGEILIRGDVVMKEYWQASDETAGAFMDGWFRTGDIGHRDADGFIYLHDRKTGVIKVAGLKVSLAEVEDVLARHPLVAECACTGVPDPLGISGEVLSAWLVPRTTGRLATDVELVAYLRSQVESHKIPSAFTWVASLPKTSSGKVQRHLL